MSMFSRGKAFPRHGCNPVNASSHAAAQATKAAAKTPKGALADKTNASSKQRAIEEIYQVGVMVKWLAVKACHVKSPCATGLPRKLPHVLC